MPVNIGFENDRDFYTAENIFYVPESARWNVIASAAHTPEIVIVIVIDTAMNDIESENESLKGVLPTLNSTKNSGDVVDIFTNKIDMAIRGIGANFGHYHSDTFTHDLIERMSNGQRLTKFHEV